MIRRRLRYLISKATIAGIGLVLGGTMVSALLDARDTTWSDTIQSNNQTWRIKESKHDGLVAQLKGEIIRTENPPGHIRQERVRCFLQPQICDTNYDGKADIVLAGLKKYPPTIEQQEIFQQIASAYYQ